MLFCISKTKNNELAHTEKPSPLAGEGVSEADGRGKLEQIRKKFLPVYAPLPLSPRKARHFPPCSGEADTKEERIHSFYYLNTLLTIIYAGFFAKSHMMFFLLSSFLFCPPLKNDGRSELHFSMKLNDFWYKNKKIMKWLTQKKPLLLIL